MIVKWGGFAFANNSCKIALRQKVELTMQGIPLWWDTSITVAGYIYAADTAALIAAEMAAVTALKKPFQDFYLYATNASGGQGTPADVMTLKNSECVGGVLITDGPNFGGQHGAEYVVQREISFTVSGKVMAKNANSTIIEFSETVEHSGGGPKYIHKPAAYGDAQKQKLWASTPYQVVQSGRIVAFNFPPKPALQLFPSSLMEAPRIRETSPSLRGQAPQTTGGGPGKIFYNYGIEYSYLFENISPLIGLPTLITKLPDW